MNTISLSVQHLNKSFGGVAATQDVSMDFAQGSLTAIIGPNGAGKTTFFNLISGALKPDSGKVLLEGDDITRMSSAQIVTKGIGRAFQVAKLFKTLTVEESLRAALMSPAGKSTNLMRRFPMAETRARRRNHAVAWPHVNGENRHRQSFPWRSKVDGYCARIGNETESAIA